MKGKVLHYDYVAQEGIILGDDEKRYSFKKDEIKNIVHVQKEMDVEFLPQGNIAKDLYLTENSTTVDLEMATSFYEDQKYSFKELFSANGCYNRWQYWRITLVSFAVWMLYGLYISIVVFNSNEIADENLIVAAAFMMFLLAPLWYVNIATSIKRFHDINLSGWFYLLILIPYIGTFIVMIMNGLLQTKKENNRFCRRKKGC